jgi:hypothetical protein
MKKNVPGLAIAFLCLLSACKKTGIEKENSNFPSPHLTNQILNPCEIRVNAAKTAIASKTRVLSQGPVVLYLDFNGQTVTNSMWNPGATMNCPSVPSSQLSSSARDFIFNSVVEDYSAFDVKVTRSEQDYLAAPAARRMRCIITYNMMDQFGNVGGIAFISSMLWADNTPCFVFCDVLLYNQKYIAGAISHEFGHTFGLDHQSRYDADCNQEEVYHTGFGDGLLGWAPIMGISYYQNLVTWHVGPSVLGCNEMQNDMGIIGGIAGLKPDDYGTTMNNSTVLLPNNGSKTGILENAADKDAFLKKETISRRIKVISNGNSDLALEVYNSNGLLNSVYDDPDSPDINVVLSGKKYLRVRTSSNQPYVPAGNGFGGYKISVSAP